MKQCILIVALVSAIFLNSCQEVIEIDLNSSNPVVVVEGSISDGNGANIHLSYTSDYFSNQQSPNIVDAVVTIRNSKGDSEILKHMGEGQYLGEQVLGEEKTSYTLSIKIGDRVFEGASSLLSKTSIVQIDLEESTFMAHGPGGPEGNPFGEPGIVIPSYNMSLKFTDDLSQEIYYMLRIKGSGDFMDFGDLVLPDNIFENKGIISFSPMMYRFHAADTVNVKIYSIDDATYKFYNELNDVSGGMMAMMGTPYNPASNLGEDVLGYFAAWAVLDTTFVILP